MALLQPEPLNWISTVLDVKPSMVPQLQVQLEAVQEDESV
jgi:hypothetical protein